MRRLAIPIVLAASLLALPTCVSAQGAKPSAAKENAEGDPSGAIRALGAAGYNDHSGRKPPPVTIPPVDMGRSERGGVPPGTAGGTRRR